MSDETALRDGFDQIPQSGKATLLNYMLASRDGMKVALDRNKLADHPFE
ncbi:MAG: hypothetical protein ACO3FE_22480 [Planctomycetaceae bacterium]|jgi:hypothetical protein